jgi:hypothetical protein
MRHAGVAVLIGTVGVAKDCTAEPLGFHFLQVAGDGFFGDIAVQPPPVGTEARFRRWRVESGLEGIG